MREIYLHILQLCVSWRQEWYWKVTHIINSCHSLPSLQPCPSNCIYQLIPWHLSKSYFIQVGITPHVWTPGEIYNFLLCIVNYFMHLEKHYKCPYAHYQVLSNLILPYMFLNTMKASCKPSLVLLPSPELNTIQTLLLITPNISDVLSVFCSFIDTDIPKIFFELS